jgi:DNA-binding winged helix-turn-helix (wHTH) protein
LGVFLGTLRSVSFGPFTLNLETRQLLRDPNRAPVRLSPKAYELLAFLIETRPRAVAKRELHERLCLSTFVSEATLASLVAEVRDALGEPGRDAAYVRTVHGFGYAFSGAANDVPVLQPTSFASWISCNGREHALGDGEHLIGRDAGVAIPLSSPTVSRHDARIVIAGSAAMLEDLQSKNGKYLRGEIITVAAELKDGDRIRIGAFELTFRGLVGDGSTETQHR